MKIIHGTSHLDHGLNEDQVNYIAARYENRTGFFIDTFEMPADLGTVRCGLYGPVMGDPPVTEDEVHYVKRGDREYESRVLKKEEIIEGPLGAIRQVRTVTVIAGPYKDEPCILYTVFGGPLSPKEPLDPSILSDEEREKSKEFWSQHALVA